MSSNSYLNYFSSPLGLLAIESDGQGISGLSFKDKVEKQEHHSPLLDHCKEELAAYFKGELKEFTVPLSLQGTPFQRKVWQALKKIAYGQTATYGEIARMIGNPQAVRAVGGANNKNRVAIIIPCHRIVGSKGQLTGYAGGLERKKWLLMHESRTEAVIS